MLQKAPWKRHSGSDSGPSFGASGSELKKARTTISDITKRIRLINNVSHKITVYKRQKTIYNIFNSSNKYKLKTIF